MTYKPDYLDTLGHPITIAQNMILAGTGALLASPDWNAPFPILAFMAGIFATAIGLAFPARSPLPKLDIWDKFLTLIVLFSFAAALIHTFQYEIMVWLLLNTR